MAAVQHSRTRSDRVGATAAASSSRRPLSMHGRPAAATAPSTPSVAKATVPSASVRVFLTNLRLLNLDLADDWPDITPATFTATTQNHKRRVQAVEWALYRLFEIWNQEETASKLNPYFPAVDQLQSVNLRAGLLRGLETAKKNGALGRDALLRKTMLDDCKGERLEEVLASFSSAVLRKTLTDNGSTRPLAVEVGCENRGYRGNGYFLQPLILAHRVSLTRALKRRREAEAKFSDFSDLLAMKERGLARRNDAILATRATAESDGVSEDVRRMVRRTVRNNWSGNERWMDALLAGDAASKQGNGLLGTAYDTVWRRVQQGRLGELEDEGKGMLQQLEGRVQAQRQRLARWDELRRDMARGGVNKKSVSPMKRKAAPNPGLKGIDLQFNSHKNLNVNSMRDLVATNAQLPEDYAAITQALEQELTAIKTNTFENALQRLANMRAQYGKADVPANPPSDPISELSDLGDMDDEHDPEPGRYYSGRDAMPSLLTQRSTSIYADSAAHTLHRSESDRSYGGARYSEDDYSSTSTSQQPSQRGNLRQQYVDYETSPTTQSTADQIFDTVSRSSNSPSPTKRTKPRHTLSLTERTRMSMARRSMNFLEEDENDLPLGRKTTAASNRGPERKAVVVVGGKQAGPAPLSVEEDEDEDDENEISDLARRTRKSMAGFEKAQQRARSDKQREMRNELRRARALPPRREGSQWEG